MKANLLIIITIVILTGAYCVNELLTFDSPVIKIRQANVINSSNGKMICYTINLYSPSQISEFVAMPNTADGDKDSSVLKVEFNSHTRRATVVYYYAVPQLKPEKEIEINFCLNNRTVMAANVADANIF
ncbi:MAG: hypothetical protein IIU03_08415 [Bacteroidales bacterium]|jgi:hypothetical protein|nr:hypothetical protein [Bacteroidales bacterium]MBQ5540241.1 hypothetical protein [Bacteroidales bacterium]MBR4679423.1 hypothetical protein [Bacteroidales bacterium]MEE3448969.1 hypothetical protein [Bacteroidales bacterium]